MLEKFFTKFSCNAEVAFDSLISSQWIGVNWGIYIGGSAAVISILEYRGACRARITAFICCTGTKELSRSVESPKFYWFNMGQTKENYVHLHIIYKRNNINIIYIVTSVRARELCNNLLLLYSVLWVKTIFKKYLYSPTISWVRMSDIYWQS